MACVRARGSIYDAHYNRFAGDSFTLHQGASFHDRADRAISREKLVPLRDDDDGAVNYLRNRASRFS